MGGGKRLVFICCRVLFWEMGGAVIEKTTVKIGHVFDASVT